MELMSSSQRGAEGLKGVDGREEMIDRPMVLQVRRYNFGVNDSSDHRIEWLQAERTMREAAAAGRLGRHGVKGARSYTTTSTPTAKKSCPSCGQPLPLQVTPCTECRTPCPLPSDLLHHALFDLIPETDMTLPAQKILSSLPGGGFDIDPRAIRMTFLKKQQRIHPDSFSGAGEVRDLLTVSLQWLISEG